MVSPYIIKVVGQKTVDSTRTQLYSVDNNNLILITKHLSHVTNRTVCKSCDFLTMNDKQNKIFSENYSFFLSFFQSSCFLAKDVGPPVMWQ